MSLCLFLPFLTCPLPTPGWGHAGVDIVVSGKGRLVLIVQCTRLVSSVNKRLVADWPVREEAPSHQCSPCIACCICNPLVVVAFLFLFFLKFFFKNRCSVGKVGRDRELRSGMRSFLGMGKAAWPTGTEVHLHMGFSTIFRWNDRQMDRQADGQYRDGPAWAIIHRNSEDFLWVPLLRLLSCLALTPPDLHLFLPPPPAPLSHWTPSFSLVHTQSL